MPLTINNLTLEQNREAMKYETKCVKGAKLLAATACFIFATVACTYNFSRWSNSNKMQDNCMELTSYY